MVNIFIHFVNKMDQRSVARHYETISNVGNCFTTPFYLKSKCKNSIINRGIQSRNNILIHLKQWSNVRKLKNHVKRYLLNLPIDPDI